MPVFDVPPLFPPFGGGCVLVGGGDGDGDGVELLFVFELALAVAAADVAELLELRGAVAIAEVE